MEFSNEEWELWTWREVSRALKVSRSWIYANVESGHLSFPWFRGHPRRGVHVHDGEASTAEVQPGVQG